MAFVFGFPQVGPAGDGVFHVFLIISNTGDAPNIGNCEFQFLVIGGMFQAFNQVGLYVGQFAVVQFLQHVQLDHGGDHVVGRLDDIKLGAAGLHLGQQFFVVGIYVVIDAAVVGLFKFRQYLGIEIVGPAVNIQYLLFFFGRVFRRFGFLFAASATACQGKGEAYNQ